MKGHHIYKDVWSPVIGEILQVEMEPDKLVHKNAICVRKDGKVVGRLKKRLMGRYAKTIFYFLRRDPFSKCTAKFVGPNLGDGEGLQVPCEMHFVGQIKFQNLDFFYGKNAENGKKKSFVPRVRYIEICFLEGKTNLVR